MISLRDLQISIRPLVNRVANMVARAVLKLVDDSQGLQVVQVEVLNGETREGVERIQNYGFSAVPPEGAEAVLVSVGGRRDHALVIAMEHRAYRIRNQESGEVAIYDVNGSTVVLKANGDIEITAAGNVILNEGGTDVAKVGSSLIAGPFSGAVTSGSSTVKVP